MRTWFVAALAIAASGAAFAQPADTRPALQQRLVAEAATNGYGTEGAQLGLDPGVPEGKSVRYAFALKAGETYYVVGGCDADCTSMALLMTDANSSGVAYTEDGEIVAHTAFAGNVHPSFTMTARKTTTYSIVINVESCHGPGKACVAGVAVFHKDGTGAAKAKAKAPATGKFTIKADGTVELSDDFEDEMYCVWDSIDEDTAAKAGAAGARGKTDPDIDKIVEEVRADCAKDYDWSQRESELALMMNSTQVVMDYAISQTEGAGVDYEDIVAIRKSLSADERNKFADGTWLQDAALVAKLEAALKAHGATGDKAVIDYGEMAIGASANQRAVMNSWVDLVRAK